MLTGSNVKMTFRFTVINTIADITHKLVNRFRVEHFVDFIVKK